MASAHAITIFLIGSALAGFTPVVTAGETSETSAKDSMRLVKNDKYGDIEDLRGAHADQESDEYLPMNISGEKVGTTAGYQGANASDTDYNGRRLADYQYHLASSGRYCNMDNNVYCFSGDQSWCPTKTRRSAQSCANAVAADSDCSAVFHSNAGSSGTGTCYCQKAGTTCEIKTSTAGSNIYTLTRCSDRTCPSGYTMRSGVANHIFSSSSTCCEADQTCGDISCPSGYTKKNGVSSYTNPTTAKCCDKDQTCGDLSCPTGYTRKSGVSSYTNPTRSKCCAQTCSGYSCPSGYAKKNGVSSYTNPTTSKCCDETCSGYSCPSGYAKKNGVSSYTNPTRSKCCAQTCSGYSCPSSYAKKNGVSSYTNPTTSKCCDETCSGFSCPNGYTKKSGTASYTNPSQSKCCEASETCSSCLKRELKATLQNNCKESGKQAAKDVIKEQDWGSFLSSSDIDEVFSVTSGAAVDGSKSACIECFGYVVSKLKKSSCGQCPGGTNALWVAGNALESLGAEIQCTKALGLGSDGPPSPSPPPSPPAPSASSPTSPSPSPPPSSPMPSGSSPTPSQSPSPTPLESSPTPSTSGSASTATRGQDGGNMVASKSTKVTFAFASAVAWLAAHSVVSLHR